MSRALIQPNTYFLRKTNYSSYGVSVAQVVASGGDNRYQRPPAPLPSGSVLSTIPMAIYGGAPCYGSASDTSMSSPHVAGVAALILSRFGKVPPGRVRQPSPVPQIRWTAR
jgi:subtilisin family serine protease